MGADIPRQKDYTDRYDMLVVNKIELAEYVGVDLTKCEKILKKTGLIAPQSLDQYRKGVGVNEIATFLRREIGI